MTKDLASAREMGLAACAEVASERLGEGESAVGATGAAKTGYSISISIIIIIIIIIILLIIDFSNWNSNLITTIIIIIINNSNNK